MRKRDADRTIRRMVREVVRLFQPDRVILFGSRARGDQRPDSDVDLLVVLPARKSKREIGVDIGVVAHRFGMPVDVIVTTPEEYEWRKEMQGTIERPAFREGKVLYARP